MANVRTGNSFFIDTAGTLLTVTGKPIKVTHLTLFPSAGSSYVALADGSNFKVTLTSTAAYDGRMFDFSANPIIFQTSLIVSLANAASATVVFIQD